MSASVPQGAQKTGLSAPWATTDQAFSCGMGCRAPSLGMRSMMMTLVVLFAGCAPVPPGDVVGGRAEWIGRWTDPAPTYTGDVRICWVDDEGLHVTAGGHSPNISVELAGDWTQPEWDTTDIGGGYSHPSGSGFTGYPFYTCEAHIGTGVREWIVDLECTEPDLSAHIVITGCERR